MILTSYPSDSRTVYADRDFSLFVDHGSKMVACSDGKFRFVDRGFTTHRSQFSVTDTTENISSLVTWLESKIDLVFLVRLEKGEEIFGTRFQYPRTVSCHLSALGTVTKIDFRRSMVNLEFTIATADKSVLSTMDSSVTPTLAHLRFPTNYTTGSVTRFSYSHLMQTETPGTYRKAKNCTMDGTFELSDTELAEVLNFWETTRHTEFATPNLLAPMFTPEKASTYLRIAHLGEIKKGSRYLWSVSISFVIGSM